LERSGHHGGPALRILVVVALIGGCARTIPQRELVDARWGQIQGLMAGITIMHGVQPLAAAAGELPWKDKYVVSLGGAALYGTAFGGFMARQRWALYVALIGPVVGLTSVLTGWALDEAGVIDATIRPDTFQLSGGVLQVAAWLIAYQLLRIDPRFAPRATVDLAVDAATLRVGWRF
jgi:hypothetical protein